MPPKLTLQTLMDNLIRESQAPFSAEDFLQKVQKQWRRKISQSTLDNMKRGLSDHGFLIGLDSDDYLPCRVVLDKIGHVPLAIAPGKLETAKKIFIPGHRMLPLLSGERCGKNVHFLDPAGNEIPKRKESFFIEDVIHFYQYLETRHFPNEIKINEWIPGKSSMIVNVWDMSKLYASFRFKPGDALLIQLQDYHRGIFQIRLCARKELTKTRLKVRSLYVALEALLRRLCEDENFYLLGLEKQLLRAFFSLDKVALDIPGFSLTDFLESLEELTVVRGETGAVQLVPVCKAEPAKLIKEVPRPIPKGTKGSLEKIFMDLRLAFGEKEFKSILYTVMGTDKFRIESVFYLLFGGEGKLFFDKSQHSSFYRQLRKLLYQICEDLKTPESRLVSELRDKCVEIKLSLIGILRFLENQQVGLEDLPEETLEQIAYLDRFCCDTLIQFSDRQNPPDLKFIRDTRLALKIVRPHLGRLEEEVYFCLGIY